MSHAPAISLQAPTWVAPSRAAVHPGACAKEPDVSPLWPPRPPLSQRATHMCDVLVLGSAAPEQVGYQTQAALMRFHCVRCVRRLSPCVKMLQPCRRPSEGTTHVERCAWHLSHVSTMPEKLSHSASLATKHTVPPPRCS